MFQPSDFLLLQWFHIRKLKTTFQILPFCVDVHIYKHIYYMKVYCGMSFLKGFPPPSQSHSIWSTYATQTFPLNAKFCQNLLWTNSTIHASYNPELQVRLHFKYEILSEIITAKSPCCHSNTNPGWQSSRSVMSPALPCCSCEQSPARINLFPSVQSINILFLAWITLQIISCFSLF